MKRIAGTLFSALLLSTISIFPAHAAASLGVGISKNALVMYWDAANFNSYPGSGTSWNDISVNNYTATLYNSPTYNRTSGGSSFSFNQTLSQYAGVPTNTIDFTGGYSISFYANFGNVNNWERIIDFGNGELANNIIAAREGTTNNIWFEVHSSGASKGVCKGLNAISNNTLDQYTFVVSANGASCNIYKNGTAFTTTIVNGTDFRPVSGITRLNNYIGRSNWSADSYFEGSIQEIAIYNAPLSASDIAQNYNSMIDVTWPTLSGGNNSVNENQSSATTITANQTSTFSIVGGADLGKFNIDSATGTLTFKSSPNYEAPDDSGANRIYDVVVRALDLVGNYNDYTFTITVLDVAEFATLSSPSLSANPYKGIPVTITVTPSAGGTGGIVVFQSSGKRIPGCFRKTFAGAGNVTCQWKPPVQGLIEISVSFKPTGSEYAPAASKRSFLVVKRSTNR